jgi:iron(III) transport system substrate-binding protein
VKVFNVLFATLLTFVVLMGWRSDGLAAPLDDLVTMGKKEGVLNLHSPSALTPQGAQELGVAFNKKYGLNVKVNYFPSKGFANDVSAIITQSVSGTAPEWDVTVFTEDLHALLAQRKLHLPANYRSLGVDAKAIDHDNGSVAFVHQITLPGYNTKTVTGNDVPKTWDELLDPKWKDGRLGIFDARYFALLAAGPWGERKTTEYVKGLARQRPFLGRLAEVYTRLSLGEVSVAPIFPDLFLHRAKITGAPVAFADRVQPVIILPYNIATMKSAAHPNLAHLFSVFMVTPEAQAVIEKHMGQSSAFIPGTGTFNFVKGKGELVFLRTSDPKAVEKWSDEYNKVLGFTK